MNTHWLKGALALAALGVAGAASAQITFFEREGFEGRSFSTAQPIGNFARFGFNDSASSVSVERARWEVCEDAGFTGRCVVLRPGQYPSLAAMGLNNRVSSVRAVATNVHVDDRRYAPLPVAPRATFYQREGFEGVSFSTQQPIGDLSRFGFNDLASSVVVAGDRWEVCDGARFEGRCAVLRPGRYPSFATMGLNNRVSSVRSVGWSARISDDRYAPAPAAPGYAYYRRPEERLFEAPVLSVRAVVGPPEQRCWIEREQVAQPQSGVNVPGAIIGAVVGGVLGHQVGGGAGKDLATVGGVVVGAAVGANVGGDAAGSQVAVHNVRHCSSVPSQARPEFWDVTYDFRGQEHRMQMTTPPGPTVTVNERGEPRA
jgi:uncharacterized protein YcfJ